MACTWPTYVLRTACAWPERGLTNLNMASSWPARGPHMAGQTKPAHGLTTQRAGRGLRMA
eukprot:10123867-Lingulodinium_polyedra.AAC.1